MVQLRRVHAGCVEAQVQVHEAGVERGILAKPPTLHQSASLALAIISAVCGAYAACESSTTCLQ